MNSMYTLSPGEEVVFELNIDEVSVSSPNKGGIFGLISSLRSDLLPIGQKKGIGVFVVTNTRCMIVMRDKQAQCCNFCKNEEIFFQSFPRWALTENHKYQKVSKTCCWCCTKNGFEITIGVKNKYWDDEITIFSHDITSDEEAQALISLLIELSQATEKPENARYPGYSFTADDDEENEEDDSDRKKRSKSHHPLLKIVIALIIGWLGVDSLSSGLFDDSESDDDQAGDYAFYEDDDDDDDEYACEEEETPAERAEQEFRSGREARDRFLQKEYQFSESQMKEWRIKMVSEGLVCAPDDSELIKYLLDAEDPDYWSSDSRKIGLQIADLYYNGTSTLSKNRPEAIRRYYAIYDIASFEPQITREQMYRLAVALYSGQDTGLITDLSTNGEETTFKLLKDLVSRGDTRTVLLLAKCYAQGRGTDKNPETALSYYKRAADNGEKDADMAFALGKAYYEGQAPLAKDPAAAKKFLQMAVDLGNNKAYLELAYCYYQESDFDFAFECFQKAADAGMGIAMYHLGIMTENGQGVTADADRATEWYRKAAENGYVKAMFTLAMHYRNKQKDYQQAVEWFIKAGENGVKSAYFYAGLCYFEGGNGIEKNDEKAHQFFLKENFLDCHYHIGLIRYAQKDYAGAHEQFEAVIKANDETFVEFATQTYSTCPGVLYQLGLLYINGSAKINVDQTKGMDLIRQAARQGDCYAITYLGKSLLNGTNGVEKDSATAIGMLTDSAEKNQNLSAMLTLVLAYSNGTEIPRDAAKAVAWAEKAIPLCKDRKTKNALLELVVVYHYANADYKKVVQYAQQYEYEDLTTDRKSAENSLKCLYILGFCYDQGLGIEKNRDAAARIFESISGRRYYMYNEASGRFNFNDILYDLEKVNREKEKFIKLAESMPSGAAFYVIAQNYRSRIYEHPDPNRRYWEYLLRAKELGDPEAAKVLR